MNTPPAPTPPRPSDWFNAVADSRGISKAARATLYAMVVFADWKTGVCWPSLARLASASGWSPRSVQRALGELARLGIITAPEGRRGGAPGASTRYRLDLHALRATGASRAPLTGDNRDRDGRTPDARGVTTATPTGDTLAPNQFRNRIEEREGAHAPGWNLRAIEEAIGEGTR